METSAALSRKLLSYGIGAGAATMAVASAHGDVHVTDFSADPITADTIYFNLMDTAVLPSSTGAEFELNCKTSGSKNKGKNIGLSSGAETVKSGGFYQAELTFKTTIGSGSAFGNSYGFMGATETGNNYGDWKVGDRGFLGLEFTITDPATMATKTFYGWADVSLNNLPMSTPITSGITSAADAVVTPCFTLYAYGYDDSGDPILAGVPEPKSTVALLIAGAAGAAALRRRRTPAPAPV